MGLAAPFLVKRSPGPAVRRLSIRDGHTAGICAYQFRTGSPGALSSGGCGLANPIVPGCALLLTCFSPSIVVMKAASIATLSTIAKMTNGLENGLRLLCHIGKLCPI